jgi:hypothetical protein
LQAIPGSQTDRNESYELLKNDTDRWIKEVRSIIGPTNIYIYPFGQQVPPNDAKFKYLHKTAFLCFLE